ncbi:MAG: hypothetical protein GY861_18715, partial [bacterium]|nr:hypothetical protein [bacterium]
SGVAGEQIILTWYGTDRSEDPSGITKVENISITADGNVKKSIVSTYGTDEATIEEVYEVEGDDTTQVVDYAITLGTASKKDTINVMSFYNVGTAKEQTILTQHFKEGAWTTGTLQKISNIALDGSDGVDWRGRVTGSTTVSYKGATESSDVESKRDSYGYSYDDFGNVLTVETDNYGVNTDTGAWELANYTITTNTFLNEINARRGNPDITETITYNSNATDKVQLRKTTTNSTFDTLGNVLTQTTETRLGVSEILDTKVVTVNDPNKMDAAGNAGAQTITTYKADDDGNIPTDGAGNEIENSYVVKTNRTFDVSGNVTNENNFHYTKEGGDFVKMEEIRSSLHHSSGVAGEQIILTWYGTDRSEDPSGITKVENISITADGNVKKSIVSTYG